MRVRLNVDLVSLPHIAAEASPLSCALDRRANPRWPQSHRRERQAPAYVYGRETKAGADIARVLTMDEARRIGSNIAKLPTYLTVPDASNE